MDHQSWSCSQQAHMYICLKKHTVYGAMLNVSFFCFKTGATCITYMYNMLRTQLPPNNTFVWKSCMSMARELEGIHVCEETRNRVIPCQTERCSSSWKQALQRRAENSQVDSSGPLICLLYRLYICCRLGNTGIWSHKVISDRVGSHRSLCEGHTEDGFWQSGRGRLYTLDRPPSTADI